MASLKLVEVVASNGHDEKFPPQNLLSRFGRKWLCSSKEKNHLMTATFRFVSPSFIHGLHLGNAGSAEVSVLVSRSGCKDFKELLPSTQLRSEKDSRIPKTSSGVRIFTHSQMRKETRHEKWDWVQINCLNPYRRSTTEQFGLAFIEFKGQTEEKNSSAPSASLEKFKEAVLKSSPPSKPVFQNPCLTRADKMLLASKASPPTQDLRPDEFFKVKIISFLESQRKPGITGTDMVQQFENSQGGPLSSIEKRIFMQIFRDQKSQITSSRSGILTPRVINSQISSRFSRKIQDTKMTLFKPQIDDAFSCVSHDNNQTIFLAEVVHNHSIKNGTVGFMGPVGKENTPLLQKCSKVEDIDEKLSANKKLGSSEKKLCVDTKRDSWKDRNDIDKWSSDQSSPDSWLKRKSDSLERSQPFNKKRPREADNDNLNCDSLRVNRITPSGGWLLSNTGLNTKVVSPTDSQKEDKTRFPFRVSPPPPTSRPPSPIPLVDDIDQPSTSSKETVAERNIRLEMERRLAERSPPERVVQRTSSGKVKGTYCTKGMNTNDSPLRRLSICDEADEVDSPQARRKLKFARQNCGEPDSVAECPVCSGFFEDIYKHLEDCFPSPLKKPDEAENDDEMACPICGLWVSKETVAAHADDCAQKRYGA